MLARKKTKGIKGMEQIVSKRIFNRKAFVAGHPYCLKTDGHNIFALFLRYESETSLAFLRLQKMKSGNEKIVISNELVVSVNDIDSGDFVIKNMTVSDENEDALGAEYLEEFEENGEDMEQNSVYQHFADAESISYPGMEENQPDESDAGEYSEEFSEEIFGEED